VATSFSNRGLLRSEVQIVAKGKRPPHVTRVAREQVGLARMEHTKPRNRSKLESRASNLSTSSDPVFTDGQLVLLPTVVTIRSAGVAVMEYVSLPASTITTRSSMGGAPGPGTK
jgi:hypothetical protein